MSHPARILVIDDDPLFRSVMSSLLGHTYTVQVASEGSEGFYRALEAPPEVAIIDLRMPNWDGLRTLKAFRAHPSLCRVRIVILTGHAAPETVDAAMRGGADDYIVKTRLHPDEFLQKLARLLPDSPEPPGQTACAGGDARLKSTAREVLQGARPAGADESRLQAILDDWE